MKKTFLSAVMVASASVLMLASCNDAKKTEVSTATATDTTKVAAMDTTKPAEAGVMVGGANMVPSKNIVENAAGSADHTTLVAAEIGRAHV